MRVPRIAPGQNFLLIQYLLCQREEIGTCFENSEKC
jgi:hypothetical protein